MRLCGDETASWAHSESHSSGLVMLGSIVLACIGILNVLYGIAALGHSRQQPAEPHSMFGSLHR
jgi:hypothetical protein